jgi:hypothetical protein
MSQREVPDTTHEAGRRCVLQALRGVDDAVLAAMRSLLVLAQSQTGSAVAVMSLLAGDEVHHVLHVGLDDVDSPLARAGCLRAMDQSLLVELPDLLDPGCALSQAQGARWRRYAAGVLTVGELPVGTLAVLCPTPGVLDATARA